MFVHGHQDNGNPTALSRKAWFEADLLAKKKASTPHMGPICYRLPGNPWGCYVDNHRIVKQLDSMIRAAINGRETLEYWSQWKNLLVDKLKQVDWSSLERAMKTVPIGKCRWASKQMLGHFAHGKIWSDGNNGHRINVHGVGKRRKIKHTLPNVNTKRQQKWNENIQALKEWMKQENSDPQLILNLTQRLQAWWEEQEPPRGSMVEQTQVEVGWNLVLDGWLCLEWRLQQEAYWAQWWWWKSSKQWTAELIKTLGYHMGSMGSP